MSGTLQISGTNPPVSHAGPRALLAYRVRVAGCWMRLGPAGDFHRVLALLVRLKIAAQHPHGLPDRGANINDGLLGDVVADAIDGLAFERLPPSGRRAAANFTIVLIAPHRSTNH
jgi:hypothetical protein